MINNMKNNDDRHLPLERWMDILVRVSAITLIKVRSVCKIWNSIITSHEFHMLYLRCFNDNREAKFLLSLERGKRLVIRHSHSFEKIEEIRLFKSGFYNFGNFIGYVDGVLVFYRNLSSNRLVKGKDFKEITLWNPSIPNIIEIPNPFKGKKNINVGFGFDNVSYQYKVVVFYMRCPYYISTRIYHLRHEFSWSSENRAKCPSPNTKLFIKPESWMTNYNGGIYWICYDTVDRNYGLSRLLRFDLSTDTYTCINLPKDDNKFGENEKNFLRLSVTNGLLTVIECYFSKHVNLWVLETRGTVVNPWKKLYSVDIPIYDCLILKNNADLLFSMLIREGNKDFNWTVSCNLKSFEKKRIEKYHRITIYFMRPYEESLVLLQQFSNKETVSTNHAVLNSLRFGGPVLDAEC